MRERTNERGSALVISVLVILAMTSLGLIAMRNTTQNITGAGNTRMNKQARYVAELGLHHAMTLMHRSGDQILKDARQDDFTTFLEVYSDGRVVSRKDENVINTLNIDPPKTLTAEVDGAPLGQFAGLTPSYRVTIDGFKFVPKVTASDAKAALNSGEGDCIMHFSSHGYIAKNALPSDEELSGDARFADYVLKAAAPMPGYANHCKRWNPNP